MSSNPEETLPVKTLIRFMPHNWPLSGNKASLAKGMNFHRVNKQNGWLEGGGGPTEWAEEYSRRNKDFIRYL